MKIDRVGARVSGLTNQRRGRAGHDAPSSEKKISLDDVEQMSGLWRLVAATMRFFLKKIVKSIYLISSCELEFESFVTSFLFGGYVTLFHTIANKVLSWLQTPVSTSKRFHQIFLDCVFSFFQTIANTARKVKQQQQQILWASLRCTVCVQSLTL